MDKDDIDTMEYYSAIKSSALCNNMDPIRDYHTKSERDKYRMISLMRGL